MLPRLYPQPMPPIHPVPEFLATGLRKQWYEDMKEKLGVPWMGVVTMAFAQYPNFFETFWTGVRPFVTHGKFVEHCHALRGVAEEKVQLFAPHSLHKSLYNLGYAERELSEIRSVVEIFSAGNYPYLLLATIARLLLEGEEFGFGESVEESMSIASPIFAPRPALMEDHHADDATRAIYQEIKSTLRLPFVNTDYRALARWPSYFSLAWSSLQSCVSQSIYEVCCRAVHEYAVEIVTTSLSNPGGLTSENLRRAAAKDAELAEVLQITRLFQWLLPGLVLNVAFMRAELESN